MLRSLSRKTILLPFFKTLADKSLDILYIICSDAGIGVSNQFGERTFVGGYAQDGFLAS